MQGFVSNKDSDEEGKGDPIETLLYAVFVASSERASVAELASILSVEVNKLQMAISIACRLGFGTRLAPTSSGKQSPDNTHLFVGSGHQAFALLICSCLVAGKTVSSVAAFFVETCS